METSGQSAYRLDDLDDAEDVDSVSRRRAHAHPGGFSNFGRFSSATVRLSRLLADEEFVGKLFSERNPDVLKALTKLRALIDNIVNPKPQPN